MRSYPNAASGLNLVFWSEILMILSGLLAWNLLGSILSIVGLVVYLVGLYRARQDDEGYGTAFTLTIVSIVLVVLSVLTILVPILAILMVIVQPIIQLVVLYTVCRTTSMLAQIVGRGDISQQGHTVWMINIICTVVSVVLIPVALIPLVSLIAGFLNVIVAIASLVGSILYLVFLYRASRALA